MKKCSCGKEICKTSIRCKSCSNKTRKGIIFKNPTKIYLTNTKKIKEKLLKNIKKNPKTKCWEWTKYRNNRGYGQICLHYNDKPAYPLTHRLSAMVFKGFNINSKLWICHKCDNPKCINPNHLFIGTPKDNVNDSIKKGRSRIGELNWKTKITRKQVKEIRKLYKTGIYSQKQLANKYNITYSHISQIVKNTIWRWLK